MYNLIPVDQLRHHIGLGDGVIIDSDSYKTSHWMQYPKDTQYVHSYLESRGGPFDDIICTGLQPILNLIEKSPVCATDIQLGKSMIVPHMGGGIQNFNEEGWEHILRDHGGRLPLHIKAIPEGTRIAPHNALVTVINTCPKCYWLVNYMETTLMRMWYPTTVATLSHAIRKIIMEYLQMSGTPELIDFMLQDFGSRGSTCREAAGIGASSHALIFKGSDTMVALPHLFREYMAQIMPLFSVPASEHSTITSWGREHEVEAIRNMMTSYPTGIVSIVSDSFNIFEACAEIFGTQLKAMVENRDGVTVIRPDSGDINSTILRCLDILAEKFGTETNSKGFRILPKFIRLLQGDGMNIHSIRALCRAITDSGWSLDNMACFGMGGKLLQSVDRDTCKFAFKCSARGDNEGIWHDVYKDPITDPGKVSQKGILAVKYNMSNDVGAFRTVSVKPGSQAFGDHLRTVFLDGFCKNRITFEEAKENVFKPHYAERIKNVANLKEA
jgi:nicotinamide phosphoribosyltransferase